MESEANPESVVWSALATAVLDGETVDWDAVELSLSESDKELARQFRVVAGIAALQDGEPRRTGRALESPLTWAHLTIVDTIGEGSFGTVYRARDSALDRDVALKLLRAPASAGTSVVDEGRRLARLSHPNIVTVYGALTVDGQTGIWMELVRGRTLADALRSDGVFSAREVAVIGASLCEALSEVHRAGLVHRDVKAHNVCREAGGRIVLTDFGAGWDVQGAGATTTAGTPLYVAPEVLLHNHISPQADIYSLGVLLYHLATAQYPVTSDSLEGIRAKHRGGERQHLSDVRGGLPAEFVAVIERALDPDPARRYQTAGELRIALLATVAAAKHQVRRRRLVWSVAAAAVVVAAWAGYQWTVDRPSQPSPGPVPFSSRDFVLVTSFENRTGDARFDRTLEHALTHELSNSSYVNVVPRERIDDALKLMAQPVSTLLDAKIGREVALRDGRTRAFVTGSLERAGADYVLSAQIINPVDGAIVASLREPATTERELFAVTRRVSDGIRRALGETGGALQPAVEGLPKVTTNSLRALRLYAEGAAAASAASVTAKWAEAEALFGSAVAEDPEFASAHIWLAWAQWNRFLAARTTGPPVPDHHLETAARAVRLVDRATQRERHFILGSHLLMTGKFDQAIGEFEALVRLYPDDFWALTKLSELYRLARRPEAVRELNARLAALRPNDLQLRVRVANDALHTRGLDAARPLVDEARALLPASADRVFPEPVKSYLILFPVHELWLQERVREASLMLDEVAQRPEILSEGALGLQFVTTFQLGLGQLRRVEATWAQDRNQHAGMLLMQRAAVALLRNDPASVVRLIAPYRGYDHAAVHLLVRAGALDEAGVVLRNLMAFNPEVTAIATAELEAAKGRTAPLEQLLASSFPPPSGPYLRSARVLADALVAGGQPEKAIALLETLGQRREQALFYGSHAGGPWIALQKRLADLYRAAGQIERARPIEQQLLRLLEAADDDYPLVRDLRNRR